MTKSFYDQVEDELRGLLGPTYSEYKSRRDPRFIKIWFDDPSVHFEAQHIGPRWGPRGKSVIEVGLHFEADSAETNDELLKQVTAQSSKWQKKLPQAGGARAFGPQSDTWRRLSELITSEDFNDPDLAGEVAERLATYVLNLRPLL